MQQALEQVEEMEKRAVDLLIAGRELFSLARQTRLRMSKFILSLDRGFDLVNKKPSLFVIQGGKQGAQPLPGA